MELINRQKNSGLQIIVDFAGLSPMLRNIFVESLAKSRKRSCLDLSFDLIETKNCISNFVINKCFYFDIFFVLYKD